MGEVSLESDPMQEAWVMHVCVTQDYPDAWESMKALAEASKQFEMMTDEDAEDVMEAAIAERGLPMIMRRLKKGGGMTTSLEFQVTVMSFTPGPVSAAEVAVKGREVTLEQFMEQMMAGGPRR